MSKSKTPIYRIKATLRHVAPPIWRRIEVPGDIKLGKLHRVLQIAMGWTDSHLHAYRIGSATYGTPNPDFPDDTQSNGMDSSSPNRHRSATLEFPPTSH